MEETNTPAEESATTENGQPQEGLVRVEEASDADLEAFLDKTEDEAPEPEEDTTEAPASKPKTEAEENKQAEPKEETQAEEPSEEAKQQEIERLQKQIETQRQYIAHRSNEIGDLRKQLRDAKAFLAQGLDEKFLENPSQAVDDKAAIREIDQHLSNLDREEAQMQYQHQAQSVILNYVSPDRIDMDAIEASLRADNFDDNFIGLVRQNPIQAMLPETFVQLQKRSEAETAARTLARGYKELSAKVKELEGKLKTTPQDVLGKLNKALKSPAPVTAANGSATSKDVTPNMNPAHMSDAEFDALSEKLLGRR